MYAIRSYYERLDNRLRTDFMHQPEQVRIIGKRQGRVQAADNMNFPDWFVNALQKPVFHILKAVGIGPVFLLVPRKSTKTAAVEADVGIIEVLVVNIIVITSYSIHYTKLYESDPVTVTLTEAGIPSRYDITDILRDACLKLTDPICAAIQKLVGSFDPDFQEKLRTNIRITSYNVCYTKLLRVCPRG